MSTQEHIFFHADVSLDELAPQIARAVQGESGRSRQGHLYVACRSRLGGEVGGPLEVNIYGPPPDPEPDELTVLDGYEYVWEIRTTTRGEQGQIDEARRLFDDVVGHLPYQVLLTHGMSILVAAWGPAQGMTEFPPKTLVEVEHKALWAPYDLPAFDPNAQR